MQGLDPKLAALGGSMLIALRAKRGLTPQPPWTILHYPVNLEVCRETNVWCFQTGSWSAPAAEKFDKVFGEHYGYLPRTYDRVDNFAVLNVMMFLGFEESVGPH
jgi:hypothetical protein